MIIVLVEGKDRFTFETYPYKSELISTFNQIFNKIIAVYSAVRH